MTFYGFVSNKEGHRSLWFHTPDAALRYATIRGWLSKTKQPLTFTDLAQTENPGNGVIKDTPETPWEAHYVSTNRWEANALEPAASMTKREEIAKHALASLLLTHKVEAAVDGAIIAANLLLLKLGKEQ